MALPFLFWSANAEAQVNAEQCLTIGRNVLSMEDYMLSIQYFNQAIKAKPYLSDPYFFRGLAKLYLEDYKGAEEDCTTAIERNKFKTESYKVRGFARQYLGKDSLAVEDYKIGLSHNPQDKYFLFYKGVAETELKRYDDADSTLGTLLRLYPGFDDGLASRGRLKALRGDTVGALDDLSAAIKISPASINPRLLRSEIEAKQKKWSEAATDLDEAVKLRPQEADLYLNRAYLRYNNDDFFGAMSDYNYALELEPFNSAALFNRALLRYEVKDLDRSAVDLESVLKIDPENFHALYNLGLVNLERGDYRASLEQFSRIIKKYPRFYPAYYAIAEARYQMGDMRGAMQNVHVAEDLIKKYVKNPGKFKLDRPTIAAGTTNTSGMSDAGEAGSEEENEIKVMEKFNQLVTVDAGANTQLSYNEKIKGRVQDRNMQVAPEASYLLTFHETPLTLRTTSNYFRELDDFNQRGYVEGKLSLTPDGTAPDEKEVEELFGQAEYFEGLAKEGQARPADNLALGVVLTTLKNYDSAIEAFDRAIAADPRFTIAFMGRGYARQMRYGSHSLETQTDEKKEGAVDAALRRRARQQEINAVVADYDAALAINPRLTYAWFNKGNLYYSLHDYTSAMQCYGEAMRIDPEFGQAYYNRGLCYLQMGNRRQAFVDLSKAGELGVVPSYNLLKRMK